MCGNFMAVGGGRGRGGMWPGGRGRGGMWPFTWEVGGVVVCGLSHGLLFLPSYLSFFFFSLFAYLFHFRFS